MYGYEYQGDNLLIARINVLMTFVEYMEALWQRKPTEKELKTVANIIAWNFWQMDGLTGTVPNGKLQALEPEVKPITMEELGWFGRDRRREGTGSNRRTGNNTALSCLRLACRQLCDIQFTVAFCRP